MSRHTTVGVILASVLVAACGGSPAPPTSPETVPASSSAPPPVPPAPPPAPAPPTSGDSIAGNYTLDLELGSGCAALPELIRKQQYSAIIQPTAAGYVVTLEGASFLSGSICTAAPSRLGCDQFTASQDGESLRFELVNENDDGHGGHIVTQVSDGTWVELIGGAAGSIEGNRLEATGTVDAWYCPTPRGYPYPCREFVSCGTDLTLTFTKR